MGLSKTQKCLSMTHMGLPKTHMGLPKAHMGLPQTHMCPPQTHLPGQKVKKHEENDRFFMKLTFSGPFSTSISPFDSEFHSGCRKNIKSIIAIDFYIQINDLCFRFVCIFFSKKNIESGYKIDTPI